MTDYTALALAKHKELKGKIAVAPKDQLDSKEKLSIYYTPGVGAVSSYVSQHPTEMREYTWTNNVVAVVSDGSAVLGLGNLGPEGALPVMEGKAMIFKDFGGLDAVPIVLNVHSADDIVAAVTAIAPSFGGINLEDIAAPICFEVEERLLESLSIPVMHDDQHGTAIVTLAGVINALRIKRTSISDCRIVVVGAGAAGVAITKLLYKYGARDITAVDSHGAIGKSRSDLNESKQRLLEFVNNEAEGELADVIRNADVFIGVSQPGLLTADMIRSMAQDPVIFAMANPVPEIMPEEAKAAGALIVATGRSDFPNQVNNALAFPGVFRGALNHNVRQITDEHKIAAAEAIAALVEKPTADVIIPNVFDERLVPAVSKVIV